MECGVRVGGSCLMIEWFSLWFASIPQERRATSIGYQGNMASMWEALAWWLNDMVSDILLFHKIVEHPSIGYHSNMVSVWEAHVWWLSDWVSAILLFHRNVEPRVLFTTGTWCPCGRFLSDDWVIDSLICFYPTGAKSNKYRLPRERGVCVGGSCGGAGGERQPTCGPWIRSGKQLCQLKNLIRFGTRVLRVKTVTNFFHFSITYSVNLCIKKCWTI